MIKHFKQYIKHCSKCQLNQTKRHRSYDELNFIVNSFISFYIIMMNFVMRLFLNKECNALLIITCKFIKKILFIFDHDIWDVAQWIEVIIVILMNHDWNISKKIISDRNFKFMLNFWKTIFNKLNIIMFIFITYHSQIDD